LKHNTDNIGYLLSKASKTVRWHLNRRLDEHSLTSSQWAVLKDLHMNESFGSVQNATPASIAERLNMDRPTMSGILTRLLRNGWVETEKNPSDKRSQIIKLTDKTREAVRDFEKISDLIITQAIKGFTDTDIENFKGYLTKVAANLES
jgi:MarR family transcriptional regulator for hemolysin